MGDTSPAAPDQCAVCGEAILPRAHACPGCGADERTGWREQSIYDGLDLPGEFSDSPPRRTNTGRRWFMGVILVTLTALLILGAFGLT